MKTKIHLKENKYSNFFYIENYRSVICRDGIEQFMIIFLTESEIKNYFSIEMSSKNPKKKGWKKYNFEIERKNGYMFVTFRQNNKTYRTEVTGFVFNALEELNSSIVYLKFNF